MKKITRGAYALAAVDMDGTLLNSAHAITPYTRAVIARAAEAGKVVALCTGRCLSELREHLADNVGIGYVIGENGACVYDVSARRFIRQLVLPDAVSASILSRVSALDVCVQCFIGNQSYMEAAKKPMLSRYHIGEFESVFDAGTVFVSDIAALFARLGRAEKINLYFPEPEARDAFRRSLVGSGLRVADSVGIGLELSPADATKAQGLEALCAHLGIPVSESMAVGDGGNDLDLMRAAGLAVAMGNAIDAVRALAGVTSEDCEHDGCAKAIQRYLLGENV